MIQGAYSDDEILVILRTAQPACKDRILQNISACQASGAGSPETQTRVKRLEAIIAPIRVVPRDILIEIFTFSLAIPSDVLEADLELGRRPPDELLGTGFRAQIILSRICFLWRDIILSTSSLWSTAQFSGRECPDIIMRQCLERSGEQRLNLSILGALLRGFGVPSPLMKKTKSRIRSLHFDRSSFHFIDDFQCLIPDPASEFTSLAELSISIRKLSYDDIEAFPDDYQPLRYMTTLKRADLRYPNHPLRMPSSLTHYKGPHNACPDILLDCPNLLELHLLMSKSGLGRPSDESQPIQVVKHASIERLLVDKAEILHYLRFPSLMELAIVEVGVGKTQLEGLSAFIDRSGCSLTHLAVDALSLRDLPDYASTLFVKLGTGSLSQLTNLSLSLSWTPGSLRLVPSTFSQHRDAFPRLTFLDILYQVSDQRDIAGLDLKQDVLALVNSRLPSLRKLRLEMGSCALREHIPELQDLERQYGLRILDRFRDPALPEWVGATWMDRTRLRYDNVA